MHKNRYLHSKTCPNLKILLFSFRLSLLPHKFLHSADSKANSQSTQHSYTYGILLLQIARKTENAFPFFFTFKGLWNYICLHLATDQKITFTNKYCNSWYVWLYKIGQAFDILLTFNFHVVRYDLSLHQRNA